ncbi:hypothetical protein F4825DRAFT_473320 [Nemania diffusa]|nr:hypothetical protein F4825DRAFT_473320 [Nemania diffusa]
MYERFGDHLYLIDCRRVCYFCFTRRLEYFPLIIDPALSFFTSNGTKRRRAITRRQKLRAANPPTVLSLPGWYLNSSILKVDKTTREPKRFMAIITAPYLLGSSVQAGWDTSAVAGRKRRRRKRSILGSNTQEKRCRSTLRGMGR